MKPDSFDFLAIILAQYECKLRDHPHQCYVEVAEGGKEEHYSISNEEMSYWSKCCVSISLGLPYYALI
jgi:hypothetical protein